MKRWPMLWTGTLFAAAPAMAQDHAMHGMPGMPGMTMPARAKANAKANAKAAPTRRVPPSGAPQRTSPPAATMAHDSEPPAAAMPLINHASMPGMDMSGDHSGHVAPAGGIAAIGTALPAGDTPPPPSPVDHFADRMFGSAAMDHARAQMMRENGGQVLSQVTINLAEYQLRSGSNGYRWEGEAWLGGDIDRLVIKSEGAGAARERLDAAEAQALYSHAIGPYFDLQVGVRHDFVPASRRSYATVGVEGLAPYMVETEAALFLSTKGELLGRIEAWYDQRLMQRLVLQPRAELNLAAEDVPETRTGAGLSEAELGLRLRYEIARGFAPYVGISYDARIGRGADFARADGDEPTTTSLVAGLRFWF